MQLPRFGPLDLRLALALILALAFFAAALPFAVYGYFFPPTLGI